MAVKVRPTTHVVKLKDRREIADRTLGVWLEKPADFHFVAGQFAEIALTQCEDSQEEQLAFSMASAPEEDSLIFATRLRGGVLKKALASLPINGKVKVEGPFGNFVLHEDAARPAVFLACGIGITPVRSIVVHAARSRLKHRIVLFYSNRRPEDAAFLEELQELECENPHYRFVGVMTQMEKSSRTWTGETGHMDYKMISRYVDVKTTPLYYVVGSPAAVQGLRAMLNDAGVTNDNIRSEDFVGY